MSIISLRGLNKADVLAALYNAAKAQGLGFMQYQVQPITRVEAEKLLAHTERFDYLNGRVMKINLSRDEFDTELYDRDNGEGAAQTAVGALRRSGETNPIDIQVAHQVNTLQAAEEVEDSLGTSSGLREGGIFPTFELGLRDIAGPLHKKVQEARNKLRG